MKNKFQWIIVVTFIIFLGGCAQYYKISESEGADRSLIYGQFDMTEASPFNYITWLEVRYESPNGKVQIVPSGNIHVDMVNRIFSIENFGIGNYQIMEIGSGGGRNMVTFNLGPAVPNITTIKVKTPGIYYMGSFKYKEKGKSFDLEYSQPQNEAQILEILLPHAQGTKWEAKMRARLKEKKVTKR